ncbi:MAG: DUF2163 domain-containing protein [Robiginitomaculum sp.]|nr:DUF2163 domain-containing protein [Robiginitomaculum sp.]
MREISQSLQNKLETGVTRLCWCWKISRQDGSVFTFTDHDQDLNFDGLVWQAATGLTPGVIETSTGFATGSAGSAGSILHDSLTAEDLKNGKFAAASVQIWRVDWQNPIDRVGVWAGELGDISLQDNVFNAELVSNSRKLDRSIGRSFSKSCDANLGDVRCGFDFANSPWSETVTILEVLSSVLFSVSGVNLPEQNWYVYGRVDWLDADKITNSRLINTHYTAGGVEVFQLLLPPDIPMQAGDQIRMIVGCGKSLTHCSARFSNAGNFRGCPFMPGNDQLLATPFSD